MKVSASFCLAWSVVVTMGAGDAGCASHAEARLTRPPAETVANVPSDCAGWIADLDDRMTGTCR